MNPQRTQRIWKNLSKKWFIPASAVSNQRRRRRSQLKNTRRSKIKRGIYFNLIPIEFINAVTGEIHKGYMSGTTIKKVREWLEYHNHRAVIDKVTFKKTSTLFHLAQKEEDIKHFPILIKLRNYQVPYVIERVLLTDYISLKPEYTIHLITIDNLNYLDIIAKKKESITALYKSLRSKPKQNNPKKKRKKRTR